MTDTSQQSANGDDIALLEFLDLDRRPAVVLDIQLRRLVHENAAFRSLQQGSPHELAFTRPTFLDWLAEFVQSGSDSAFSFVGKSWDAVRLRARWVVITKSDKPPSVAADPTHDTKESDIGRRHSQAFAGTAHSASSPMTDGAFNHLLDWTKYSVSGISAYVQSIKAFPWETTGIGHIDSWSDIFRSTIIAMNANSEARILLWGSERTMIYNEACAPLFGQKHPLALGGKPEDIWSEAWPALATFVSMAETEGKATRLANIPLTMQRHGYDEETFWIANFVPIIGPRGKVVGVLDEFTETTLQVIQDRRRDLMIKTSEIVSRTDTLEQLWDGFLEGVQRAESDIAYAAIYVPTDSNRNDTSSADSPKDSSHFTLHGLIGAENGSGVLPASFDLSGVDTASPSFIRTCHEAWRTGEMLSIGTEDGAMPLHMAVSVPGRCDGYQVKNACIVPIPNLLGSSQLAFAVFALTPRRPFDGHATGFIRSLSDILIRSASTIFLPDEHRRARQRFEDLETSFKQRLEATNLQAEQVEARYEKLINQVPVGICVFNPAGKLTYHNEAYMALTGATSEFATSDHVQSELISDEDRDRVSAMWQTCVESKLPMMVEYRVKKQWKSVDVATGQEIQGESWILASVVPDLDSQGNLEKLIGWLLDISDRKYHEAKNLERLENEQAERRFARLAEKAPMGMYLLKPDGTPLYLNDAYFEILGFTREDFRQSRESGQGWDNLIADEDRHIAQDAWTDLAERGLPINVEYRVKKPWSTYDNATGTEITGPTWLRSIAFAERNEKGEILTVQGFVSDISMKKFSERLLAERLEEALETKRQADRFIDMTSHEMRNPLSAILQSADGILTALGVGSGSSARSLSLDHTTPGMSSELTEAVVDAAQTIVLCAQHQKRIVDDILTLSKLDSNLLVISPDKTFVPGLITKCFKMYEAELNRVGIAATLEIEEGYRTLDVHNVMLDSSRVLQVIINLLTNAIKFTQHAAQRRIVIFLDASKDKPDECGVNAQFIDRRPNRPDATMLPEWGTGEELYLQVAVQDTGQGLTQEELKLLFHRFSQANPKTYKQYGGSGLGLFISRELTELQGGQIGVYSKEGMGSTFTFYVKAKRVVGDDEPLSQDMQELVVNAPRRFSRDARAANPDTEMNSSPKPSLAMHNSAPAVLKTADRAGTRSHLHILVVEDNEINQRVMSIQLRRIGCTVYIAQHGLEALEFLERTTAWNQEDSSRRLPQGAVPVDISVVLMDLEMPVLGGLDTVKRIRALQLAGKLVRHVPVIAVTANARSEQIADAIKQGMDSVVTKPFRIPELVPQMEALVAKLAFEKS